MIKRESKYKLVYSTYLNINPPHDLHLLSLAQTCPIVDLSNFKIIEADFIDSNCAIKLPFLSY